MREDNVSTKYRWGTEPSDLIDPDQGQNSATHL